MFACGISSFTHIDEFRLPETPSVDHRDTSHDIEDRDQIPHPLCMGVGKVKAVKFPGYARGDVEASI